MKSLLLVLMLCLACVVFAIAQVPGPESVATTNQVRTAIVGEIQTKDFPEQTIATVLVKAADYVPEGGYKPGMEGAGHAYSRMMEFGMSKLMEWIKAGNVPQSPMFGIYFEYPEKTAAKDLTCKFGFFAAADAQGTDVVKIETLPAMTAAVVQFKGPYEGSIAIWNAIEQWIRDHQLESSGPPMEIYLRSPGDGVTPDEYLTEIRIPVVKAGAKKEDSR